MSYIATGAPLKYRTSLSPESRTHRFVDRHRLGQPITRFIAQSNKRVQSWSASTGTSPSAITILSSLTPNRNLSPLSTFSGTGCGAFQYLCNTVYRCTRCPATYEHPRCCSV
ncbi:hypothetical protein M378DRAFT_171835 [Amanita muscaria Koide BX008]|uniref:Uncharacterized protein n=1 Tax=Amanita muscaria (strain Koide BX008) TaxID=946122 RepID=A0A0C2WMG8_AMAMK|nr:hypothetical protein M378DRAFT_171835 [Amanita muscaria Koide BX008]